MSPKKKAAKKKTVKAAKKKKSSPGSTSRMSRVSQQYTITLRSSIPCSYEMMLKKHSNSSVYGPDKVRWTSADGDYKLTFSAGWPFSTAPDSGDPADLVNNPPVIVVNPHSSTRYFKVDPNAATIPYPYDIQPPAAPHPRDPGLLPGPVIDVSGP